MPHPDEMALDELSLRAALDLDQGERAYLASLDLAATWRTQPSKATDSPWGWIALTCVVAAFIGWTLAAEPFGDLLTLANQVGLSTVMLGTAFWLVLQSAISLIDVSTSPALSLSQPVLAVLALALLFWPRIKSAPHSLQGVLS